MKNARSERAFDIVKFVRNGSTLQTMSELPLFSENRSLALTFTNFEFRQTLRRLTKCPFYRHLLALFPIS